jgi:hypothetical protein
MQVKYRWLTAWFALLFLLSAYALTGQTAEKKPAGKDQRSSSQFIRIIRDKKNQPMSLESAIVRYVPKDRTKTAPVVDLVAALHIGEKSYYEQLNREFKNYDSVLYELVAPEGTRVPKGGGKGSGSIISIVQKAMKDVLELEFQLEMIDYTQGNLIHADMSPDQFAESMKKRGESVIVMFARMMFSAMAQSANGSAPSDMQLIMALLDKNRAMALKRIMAEQFQSMDGMISALEGKNGSTLIGERNKIALETLRKQIGKGDKKLAIFYGGGHMPDFDKRLRADFGLVPAGTRWLTAWNLKSVEKPAEKPAVKP